MPRVFLYREYLMNEITQDLRAIIEELAMLEKRLDALKLKIDLAHGSKRAV